MVNASPTSGPPKNVANSTSSYVLSQRSFIKAAVIGVISLGLCITWLPAANIAANGLNARFKGKFQGEIIPTVPRGSYFTYDLAPRSPKGKLEDLFSTLVHFLIFLMALVISGIII